MRTYTHIYMPPLTTTLPAINIKRVFVCVCDSTLWFKMPKNVFPAKDDCILRNALMHLTMFWILVICFARIAIMPIKYRFRKNVRSSPSACIYAHQVQYSLKSWCCTLSVYIYIIMCIYIYNYVIIYIQIIHINIYIYINIYISLYIYIYPCTYQSRITSPELELSESDSTNVTGPWIQEHLSASSWIGWSENLEGTMVFYPYRGFLQFSSTDSEK